LAPSIQTNKPHAKIYQLIKDTNDKFGTYTKLKINTKKIVTKTVERQTKFSAERHLT